MAVIFSCATIYIFFFSIEHIRHLKLIGHRVTENLRAFSAAVVVNARHFSVPFKT